MCVSCFNLHLLLEYGWKSFVSERWDDAERQDDQPDQTKSSSNYRSNHPYWHFRTIRATFGAIRIKKYMKRATTDFLARDRCPEIRFS